MRKKSFVYAVIVMILGLLSRKFKRYFPLWVNAYVGDVLWALMIFFGVTLVFPRLKLKFVVILSLLFCYIDEILQLYHGQWIEKIRSTTIGGLILGFKFSWTDITCYSIGISIGMLFLIFRKEKVNYHNI